MSERFKKWYEKNKLTFNAKRKSKYNADPIYRDAVKEKNKESKNNKKGIYTRDYIFELDGNLYTNNIYTSTELANLLNCSLQTLYTWEKNKTIPMTPLVVDGKRYYSLDFILLIAEILEKKNSF